MNLPNKGDRMNDIFAWIFNNAIEMLKANGSIGKRESFADELKKINPEYTKHILDKKLSRETPISLQNDVWLWCEVIERLDPEFAFRYVQTMIFGKPIL